MQKTEKFCIYAKFVVFLCTFYVHMKKVSVIVPNYNHAPYLKERVDSILAQDYPEMEIILLDDASSDESAAILGAYAKHPRVTAFLRSETNSGNPFIQWQRGIRQATGDYIWIAESDDVAAPTMLSRLVAAMETQDAVLAFAQSRCIDEQGRALPRRITAPFLHDFAIDGKTYVLRHLLGENTICNASAVLFRREAANTVDMAEVAQYRVSGDRLFWIRIAWQGRVAFVAEPLNRFRQHTQKVSIAAAGQGLNCIQDHHIYQQVRSLLPLTTYQQGLVCGYHWQAMHQPWVTPQGRECAMREWQKEPLFGWWSWLVYKLHRIVIRTQGTCSI